jgi:hypothetical protein
VNIKRIVSAIILGLLTLIAPAQYGVAGLSARAWYVSTTGSNGDGQSWTSAWTNLDAIAWANISAGDTVYLDGGTSSLVYTGTLTPRSGVTVALSQEAGRSGQAVLFGGRNILLPDCDSTYTPQTLGVRDIAIDYASSSDVTVDGGKWSGIVIHGYGKHGVKFSSGSLRDTLRYVEIYDNGQSVLQPSGKYRSDQPGVFISGSGSVVDHALIHDNGQDAFQSSGGISGISITNSWLYNARTHPSNPSLAFNYCMHSDGMQVYNGGTQSGVTFDYDVIGPGLMQGTLLGQTPSTVINNVTLHNVLVLDGTNANIMGYDQIASQNWSITNVTSFHVLYDPDAGAHHNILLRGQGHQLRDSILYGGDCYIPDGITTSGDFNFNTSGCAYGSHADPQFKGAPPYNSQATIADLIAGDYSLLPGSPATGKGSALTSVAMLLGSLPANTPTPTWTPIVAPTFTPTYTPTSSPTVLPTGTSSPTQSPTITPTYTPTETPTNVPTPVVRQVLCAVTTYPGGRVTIDCP